MKPATKSSEIIERAVIHALMKQARLEHPEASSERLRQACQHLVDERKQNGAKQDN